MLFRSKGHGYFKWDPDGNAEPLLYVGSPSSVDMVPPSQVTGLSVSTISSDQLKLAWTQNTEPDLDNYNIYRGTKTGFTVAVGTTPPTGTSAANSYFNTGLNPSTTYYFRVAAVDKAGNIGAISSEKSGSTANPPDIAPPAQVTGVIVTTQSSTRLDLMWNQNLEPDLNHYNIYRGTSSNFPVTLGETPPMDTSNTNSYQSTRLDPSTTYYYKVAAVDNTGNSGLLSVEKSGTTSSSFASSPQDKNPPPKVKGLSIKTLSDSELSLKWTAVKASDLDHYNIYASTKSKFTVIPDTTPPVGTATKNTYSSTGLHFSTKYYYKVAAVDEAGNIGKLSSTKSGKTNAVSDSSIINEDLVSSLKANSTLKGSAERKIDQSHIEMNNGTTIH